MNSPLPHPLKQEKSPSRFRLAEENFSRNDVLYILVSLHSFHLKRNERLPLLARENKAPPAYRLQKEEESFLQAHEKEEKKLMSCR